MMLSSRIAAVGVLLLALVVTGCHRQEKTVQNYQDSGNRFFAQGKFAEAIIEYRNVLRLDQKYGVAWYQLGETFMKLGNTNGALNSYIRAADLMPNVVDPNLKAGQLLLLQKKFEDAKSRAETVLGIDPKNVPAKTLRGMAMLGLRDADGADQEINQAISMEPKNPGPLLTRAALEKSRGQYREAEATLKQAIELDTKSVDAWMQLAILYLAYPGTNRKDEAATAFKEIVKLDSKNVGAQQALARYYMESGRMDQAEAPLKVLAEDGKSVGAQLALADYYVKVKRDADAVAVLEKAAATEAGFALASVQRAKFDYDHQKTAEAYKRLDEVLKKEPENTDALVAKGRFLLNDKKINEAQTQAQAALKFSPRSGAAQYLMGMIALAKNDRAGAIKSLDEVVKLEPNDANAKVLLSQLYYEQGSFDLAQQFADNAVKLVPGWPPGLVMQAKSLVARGSVDPALEILKNLVQKRPTVAPYHAAYGDALSAKGDVTGARREFTRARELDPKLLDAVRGQIVVELRTRNLDKARDLAEAQVKATPTVPALLLAAGTYAEVGDLARQEALLRQVLEADSTNSQAYAGLAMIFARQGKLDEALKEYQALAQRFPKSVQAPTMIGLILEVQHKPAEAQKVYEKLLATNPTGATVAANNLAWLYAESGANLDAALQLAQGAKQASPETPEIADTLGWIYLKKDLAGLAIPEFQSSVQADPKKALYHYHLGLALAKVGKSKEAKEAFDAALKNQPGYREAEDARKRLPPG